LFFKFETATFATPKQIIHIKPFKNMATSKFTNEQHKQAFDLLIDFQNSLQALGKNSNITFAVYNDSVFVSISYSPTNLTASARSSIIYTFEKFCEWLETTIESTSEILEQQWHEQRCHEAEDENNGLTFEYDGKYHPFYVTDLPYNKESELETIGDDVTQELNRTANEFSEKFFKAFEALKNKIKAIV